MPSAEPATIPVEQPPNLAENLDRMLAALLSQPQLAYRPEKDLADQFGLPESLTADVIRQVSSRRNRNRENRFSVKQLLAQLKVKWMKARSWVDGHTLLSLLSTFAIGVLGILEITLASSIPTNHVALLILNVALTVVGTMTILLALFGQAIVLFVGAKSRWGWVLAGIWTIVLILVFIPQMSAMKASDLSQGHSSLGQGIVTKPVLIALMIFACFFLGLIDGLLNLMVCLIGAYFKVSSKEKEERSRTRKEQLARMMEIQDIASQAKIESPKQAKWPYQLFRKYWPYSTVVIAFLVELPAVLVQFAGAEPVQVITVNQPPPQPGNTAFLGILSLLGAAMCLLVGSWSRTTREAWLNFFAIEGVRVVAVTMFIERLIRQGAAVALIAIFGTVISSLFYVFLGYLAKETNRRTQFQKKLAQNDPATLLVEMARLKLVLGQVYKSITVMAIDAAKSSEMKRGEDPMIVEYTFRAYQEWIESTCGEFGGEVHSTAGDGAIVAFKKAELGFQAAKRLQSTMGAFNQAENKLATPFRIRIGLHSGKVLGELDSVVFTSVIDIAAHVEAAAPIGGIALTDRTRANVAEEFQDEPFAELSELVDHETVFVALSPMDEPAIKVPVS